MRHGLAESQFAEDFTRQLSKRGEQQALNIAEQIRKNETILPTAMLASPFSRTQSTANIVHQKLGLINPIKSEDMLVHFGDHKILGDFLLACDYEHLIIISHMPIVARLCQYLVSGCNIQGFRTAQTIRLDFTYNDPSEPIIKIGDNYSPNC